MKNINSAVLISLVSIYAASNTVLADDCDYSTTIDRTFDIAGIKKLEVEAGAGLLDINGKSGRQDILIRARLCSSSEEVLEKMAVESVKDSDMVHIETQFPNKDSWFGSESAHIDLRLTIPSGMHLDVEDSSGRASVKNVASLSMKDSSGELVIEDVQGDLAVIDSSGSIEIEGVGGDVELTDSSGGIYASDVTGSVLVIADSSGEIRVKDVAKDVIVERDSSGAIDVTNVGGDFTVDRDSSGGIKHKNVLGKVSIPQR